MRCLLTAFAVLAVAVSTAQSEEVFRELSYKGALAAAEKEGKVVLVDFYTTWCGPCKKLDKTTWKDKDVQAWIKENAIALKIDAEKERALAKSKNVSSYPTILLLKPDETVIDVLSGYRDAKTFLKEVDDALAGKDSLTRAKEALVGDKKNDPSARMEYADELASRGRHKEALEEYLWCFDHGVEHSSSFVGVRVSFLLSRIGRLGRAYEPALDALKERRDAAEKRFKDAMKAVGEGKAVDTDDLDLFDALTVSTAVNHELDDKGRTLDLFDELCKQGDAVAFWRAYLLDELLETLIEARRYTDIMKAEPDALARVDREIASYSMSQAMVKDQPGLVEFMKEDALDKGGMYFEAALGAGETKIAKKIVRRLLRVERSARTYTMLIEHALRAEDVKMAGMLAKLAKKRLPDEECAKLSEIVGKIPTAATSQPAEETKPEAESEQSEAA